MICARQHWIKRMLRTRKVVEIGRFSISTTVTSVILGAESYTHTHIHIACYVLRIRLGFAASSGGIECRKVLHLSDTRNKSHCGERQRNEIGPNLSPDSIWILNRCRITRQGFTCLVRITRRDYLCRVLRFFWSGPSHLHHSHLCNYPFWTWVSLKLAELSFYGQSEFLD